MLGLENLEIIKQMQSEDMSVKEARNKLFSSEDRKKLPFQKPIHAPFWSLYLPFAMVTKPQARKLWLWGQSRKVHHWMRALLEGKPLFAKDLNLGQKNNTDSELAVSSPAPKPQHAYYRKVRAQQIGQLEPLSTCPVTRDSLHCQSVVNALESKQLLVCGMGGSSIGIEAIEKVLQREEGKSHPKTVLYLSTTDPSHLDWFLSTQLQEKTTTLVLISKSGSTWEVHRILEHVLSKKTPAFFEEIIAITEEGSKLWNHPSVTKQIPMHPGIGGRFSSSAILGEFLISYKFGKRCYEEFLEGACDMDAHALRDGPWENLPLSLALVRLCHTVFRQQTALCIAPYIESLSGWTSHVQQLEMESMGKSVDLFGKILPDQFSGPLIFGDTGPQCQHTYFQWIHQALKKSPVEFIAQVGHLKSSDIDVDQLSHVFGQMIALASGTENKQNPHKQMEGSRSSWLLATETMTAKSLGALLALYEHTVAFESFLLGVNAFDQEGVELGKKISSVLHQHLESDLLFSKIAPGEFLDTLDLDKLLNPTHKSSV